MRCGYSLDFCLLVNATLKRGARWGLIATLVILITPSVIILALRWVAPPWSAYMLRTHWQAQADGPTIYYHWVDIGDMAACMPLAVVAAEDQTFPYHRGFEWDALRTALAHNLSTQGQRLRGGSTISQQTAKNLFLWPTRSYARKAVEGYLTLWLELLWPKRRILEMYLNIAQFDDYVFGVGAAAQRLFGTTAAALTQRQCAALAAVLPAPRRFNAAAPSAYTQRRINWIMQQMRQLGQGYLADIVARK